MLNKIMELRVSLSSKLDLATWLSYKPHDLVIWKSLVCDSLPSLRAKFCFWMIARGRLPTCDRLFRLGFGKNQLSFLCGLVNESLDHILHTCEFVQDVRSMLFRPLGDMFFGYSIQEAIVQFSHYASQKN